MTIWFELCIKLMESVVFHQFFPIHSDIVIYTNEYFEFYILLDKSRSVDFMCRSMLILKWSNEFHLVCIASYHNVHKHHRDTESMKKEEWEKWFKQIKYFECKLEMALRKSHVHQFRHTQTHAPFSHPKSFKSFDFPAFLSFHIFLPNIFSPDDFTSIRLVSDGFPFLFS